MAPVRVWRWGGSEPPGALHPGRRCRCTEQGDALRSASLGGSTPSVAIPPSRVCLGYDSCPARMLTWVWQRLPCAHTRENAAPSWMSAHHWLIHGTFIWGDSLTPTGTRGSLNSVQPQMQRRGCAPHSALTCSVRTRAVTVLVPVYTGARVTPDASGRVILPLLSLLSPVGAP